MKFLVKTIAFLGRGMGGVYKVTIKPFWKWVLGAIFFETTYEYGKWEHDIGNVEAKNIDNMPIRIHWIHNLYLWLYNVKLVKIMYGVISNIAFYCKVPIYVVTIILIIIFLILLIVIIKSLLKPRLQATLVFDKNNPETFIQQAIVKDVSLNEKKQKETEEKIIQLNKIIEKLNSENAIFKINVVALEKKIKI